METTVPNYVDMEPSAEGTAAATDPGMLVLENGGEGDSLDIKFFSTRKPKDAMAGLSSGLKNIGKGVGSGIAAAVALPVMGAKEGGVAGFATGLGAGIMSAIGLPVAGVATGVYQIGRGIFYTPEAIMEANENKVWNKETREWYVYDLQEEASRVLNMSEEEFLEGLKKKKEAKKNGVEEGGAEAESKAKANAIPEVMPARKVKDTAFYDLMGIKPNATPGQIKKAYYLQARKLHPDKNPNDPKAHKKFQELGATYSVLSDPALRERYDKHGKDGVENDVPVMDSAAFLMMIFGSDKFDTYVGELKLAMLLSKGMEGDMQDENALSALFDDDPAMAFRQNQREVKCTVDLAKALQIYVDEATAVAEANIALVAGGQPAMQAKFTDFRAYIEGETKDLTASAFGGTLLRVIGYVYVEQAEKQLGFKHSVGAGMGFTTLKSRGHVWASRYRVVKSLYSVHKSAKKMEKEQQKATQDELAKKTEADAAFVNVVNENDAPAAAQAVAQAAAAGAGADGSGSGSGTTTTGANDNGAAAGGASDNGDAVSGNKAQPAAKDDAGSNAAEDGAEPKMPAKKKSEEDMEAGLNQMLGMIEALWNMSVIDVENTLRAVCFKLFKDSGVTAANRVQRAKGLLLLGQMFMAKGVSAEEGIEAFTSEMKKQMDAAQKAQEFAKEYEASNMANAEAAAAATEQGEQRQAGAGARTQANKQQAQQPATPQRVFTREELEAMKPKELRAILVGRGMNTIGCLEKNDFINKILDV